MCPSEEELQRQPMEKRNSSGLNYFLAFRSRPSVESQINSIRGGGRLANKPDMLTRFGYYFGDVRVTRPQSSESAKAVNAGLYDWTRCGVWRGQYSGDGIGKKLITHELTHVVQQAVGRCHQRAPEKEKGAPEEKGGQKPRRAR
jgi:hypothetical protein